VLSNSISKGGLNFVDFETLNNTKGPYLRAIIVLDKSWITSPRPGRHVCRQDMF